MTKILKAVLIPIEINNKQFKGGEQIGHVHGHYQFIYGISNHPRFQLLLLDEEIEIKDDQWYLNKYGLIKQATCQFEYDNTKRKDGKLILSSYPQLENTILISKQDIQEWINRGMPEYVEVEIENRFVKGNYLNICSNCKKEINSTDKLWFLCHECSFALKLTNAVII